MTNFCKLIGPLCTKLDASILRYSREIELHDVLCITHMLEIYYIHHPYICTCIGCSLNVHKVFHFQYGSLLESFARYAMTSNL